MKRTLAILMAVLILAMGLPMMAGAEGENKLVFQMSGEPDSMDPTMNDYSTGSYALQSLFRGLYKFAEDGTLVPALAESHTVSEDGMVYTFALRKELKWSDGSPLTAHDFEYSWKRVLNPEFASETAYTLYGVIKNGYECFVDGTATLDDLGVKALDDDTLEVTLVAPAPYFISMTATTAFMPVQKATVEANGEAWQSSPATYVCNGPFMVSEMKPDEKYIFVKNPNYYNADEVKLDALEYVFLNAPETVLIAFENGEVDVATSVNVDAKSKFGDTDQLMLTDRIGYRYYEFNTESEAFKDARVRKAFTMAIDRDVLISAVMQDDMPALRGFIPHAFPDIADETKSWREVHGDSFQENIEDAKQLLADAGYPDGEGLPHIRMVQTPDAGLVKTAQAMAQMWKQNLGVDVEIVTVEDGVYWADGSSPRHVGDFEIAYMGYTGDYLDPSSLLYNFESGTTDRNTRWGNERFDELMKQARAGATGAEREAVFEEAEQILSDECPVIPVYSYVAEALISSRVKGFTRNYVGHPNFEYASIEQ